MSAFPGLKTLCAELVELPSVSSENAPYDQSNRAIIERLSGWLADAGFACEVMPVPEHAGKFNLIATRGHGPGGLVLSGHTDTVPYDETGWTHDPFKLTERDHVLSGLGICDMKGFLGMAVELAAELQTTELKRPLIIVGTADEESTMSGARALVAAGKPKARYALIGEPTGLKPVRMHKGILMDSLRVHGHAGHSSRPDLGANAIEGMHQVLAELVKLRDELKTRGSAKEFAIPHPTLNLGHIHGGDSANRIPPSCELQVDMRFPPGFEVDALRNELRQRSKSALNLHGCSLECGNLFEGIPALQTPADSALVRACEKLTGHTAGAVDFATEGPFLNQLGLDTVVLGPGDIEVAHQPNEHLPLERIPPMRRILRALVRQFCL